MNNNQQKTRAVTKSLLIAFIIICIVRSGNVYCQEIEPVETGEKEKWMEYVEELAEDADENSESLDKLYQDLSELAENPLNLNRVTTEQLKEIPFLSDVQIQGIMDYLKKQRSFATIYELKNIRELDMQTIELIIPFLYVEATGKEHPFTVKNMLKYGKNEFITRYDRCLNEKSGYKTYPDSILQKYPNRKYVGEPFYTSLRYAYTFDDRLQMGIVAEKDAGEAFWNSRHKGYDYYSAHVFLKNTGKISSLAIGDYKVSFGQGLVISNDFTPSRSSVPTQAERRNNGFRRHYSTNENDFFRGVASTVSINNLNISAFYSNRPADATTDGETISAFKTDGLHRTPSDLAKRNNINIHTFGGNARYVNPLWHVGLTAVSSDFGGLSVDPAPQPYNRFYFRGGRNTNASVDYAARHGRTSFFGETALSQNGAAATLNALQWNGSSGLKALVLYRYYDRRYQAFYGNAFSQGSTVQNEEGLYVSMQCEPFAHVRLSGYADFFRYPWMKYLIDAPSSGQEYMLQAHYTGIKRTTLSARYRFRRRDRNVTDAREVAVQPVDQQRVRLQMIHQPSETLTFRTEIEGNVHDSGAGASASYGYMVSQRAGWKNEQTPVQADVYVAFFNAGDYNSRVYSSEKNMPYTFSIPSFYGKGARLSAVWRYNLTQRLYASVKTAWTHYFNRNKTGSDQEEIEGNNKTDLYAMTRWKF